MQLVAKPIEVILYLKNMARSSPCVTDIMAIGGEIHSGIFGDERWTQQTLDLNSTRKSNKDKRKTTNKRKLPMFFELTGILYSMPLSDILTFIMTAIIAMHILKDLKESQRVKL